MSAYRLLREFSSRTAPQPDSVADMGLAGRKIISAESGSGSMRPGVLRVTPFSLLHPPMVM